jgi:hypothetical protein
VNIASYGVFPQKAWYSLSGGIERPVRINKLCGQVRQARELCLNGWLSFSQHLCTHRKGTLAILGVPMIDREAEKASA